MNILSTCSLVNLFSEKQNVKLPLKSRPYFGPVYAFFQTMAFSTSWETDFFEVIYCVISYYPLKFKFGKKVRFRRISGRIRPFPKDVSPEIRLVSGKIRDLLEKEAYLFVCFCLCFSSNVGIFFSVYAYESGKKRRNIYPKIGFFLLVALWRWKYALAGNAQSLHSVRKSLIFSSFCLLFTRIESGIFVPIYTN